MWAVRRERLSRALSRSLARPLTRPLVTAVAVGATGALALSGCGLVESDLRPGVAASVGEWSVSVKDLDDLTTDVCRGLVEVNPTGQAPVLRDLRLEVLNALLLREVTGAVGAELGASEPRSEMAGSAEFESQLEAVEDDEARDALREVLLASRHAQAAIADIGAAELGDAAEGEGPTDEERDAAGFAAVEEWLAGADVEVNPRYGVTVGPSGLTEADTSLAVGEVGTAVSSSGSCA